MLTTGTRLGPYEITGSLGAGGMGEVYRARDTRLNRDVALKILPDTFASDPDRVARFTREAQTLASLNHPHIAQIYSVEGGTSVPPMPAALVMELVDGETLADRIARGPIPLDEALPIARQIAEALEAAHEQGIIHRDLKPANIKVHPDGTVKVLDFGLAKALAPAAFDAAQAREAGALRSDVEGPTITSPAMTAAGVILGTAAYMSPEQAKGRSVDKRADIWAFGVVLFEMLTGRRLFDAETIAETIGLVVTREPDLTGLPPTVPPRIRHLIGRCLEREPKARLRDIGEARIALEKAAAQPDADSPGAHLHDRISLPWRYRLAWMASLALTASLTAVAAWLWPRDTPVEAPFRQFTISAPDAQRITDAAISPDGRMVSFIAGDRIWLRRLDELDARELPGTEDAHAVFWSPDSQFVAFEARGALWKMPIGGGAPAQICRVPGAFSIASGVAWLEDDRIVFTTGGTALLEVSAQGGTPRTFLEIDKAEKELDFHDVSALPGGKGVLFIPHPPGGSTSVDVFDGRQRRRVLATPGVPFNPTYAPSGHLVYNLAGNTWAVQFSLANLTTTGEPFVIAPRSSQPTVSTDGTLVLVPGAPEETELVWVDRITHAATRLGRTGLQGSDPRLSPDGRLLAMTIDSGNEDIWILDAAGTRQTRLTFEPENDRLPTWSPDGKSIVYQCGRAACARPADGTGQRQRLVEDAVAPHVAPDGKALLFSRGQGRSDLDLWIQPIPDGDLTKAPTAAARALVAEPGLQRLPLVSPDGRFLAYESFAGPSRQILVTRYPSADGRWEVSNTSALAGGGGARWSPKGDRLFFQDRLSNILEVEITSASAFVASPPRMVLASQDSGAIVQGFERSNDGARFLVARSTASTGALSRLIVIENWAARHPR